MLYRWRNLVIVATRVIVIPVGPESLKKAGTMERALASEAAGVPGPGVPGMTPASVIY